MLFLIQFFPPCPQLLLKARSELFAPGTYIARAEEEADRLMVIVSGRVRIFSDRD
jgi:CRP-like cAMP-binding protein